MERSRVRATLWVAVEKTVRWLERSYWSSRLNMDPTSRVSLRAHVRNRENIYLGPYSRVFRDSVLDFSMSPFSYVSNPITGQKGIIRIGDKTSIRPHACLYTYGGSITLGKNCTVNPFVVIYGHGGVSIGDYVRIAA